MAFYPCYVSSGGGSNEYAYGYDTTFRRSAYSRFTIAGTSDNITYDTSTYQFTVAKAFKARICLNCYNSSSHSTTKYELQLRVNGVTVYTTPSFGGGSYGNFVTEYDFQAGDTFGIYQDYSGGDAWCRFIAVTEI